MTASTAESFSLFLQALARTPEVSPELVARYQELCGASVVLDGDIEVGAEIASGGMGRVFGGWDRKLERRVALKFVRLEGRDDDDARKLEQAFEREARATAQLNHPNIVTVYGYGSWRELPYLVLEMMEGQTLAERLRERPLALEEVLEVATQLLRGLEHAHDHGALHRDLKPQNIFLRHDGVVKIMDFGLTSQRWRAGTPGESRATWIGAGTPGYMAPEQAAGRDQDERTDLWAVGVLLYEMATGSFPPTTRTHTGIEVTLDSAAWSGDPAARPTGAAVRQAPISRKPERLTAVGVSPALAAIIERAIADAPAARYPSAAAMRLAIEALATPRAAPARGPRAARAGLAAIAALVGLVLLWWVLRGSPATRSTRAPADRVSPELLHTVHPDRDRPVALAEAPDLRGDWAQENQDPGRFRASLSRRDPETYYYYRTTRQPGAPASPDDVIEEGELRLYQQGGKQFLAGTLVTHLEGRPPPTEIVVEFEVVSPDRLLLTASFFRNVGEQKVDYFYVDKIFVRVAPPPGE